MRTGCKSERGLSRLEFNETLPKRFASKCGEPDVNGCIPWIATRTAKGYGILHYGKSEIGILKTTAHRIAWVIARGDLAPSVLVLHRCDNPSCVNADHMFLGSQQENMDDMMSKGRHSWRNGQPWQKLNVHDVERIREMRKAGHTQQAVADQLGISRPLISMIEHGKIQHAQVSLNA